MPYCKSKEREKARFDAVREVLRDGRKPAEVARRFGVYRSTIKRWVEGFLELQKAQEITWYARHMPTKSARPKHSPKRISFDLSHYHRSEVSAKSLRRSRTSGIAKSRLRSKPFYSQTHHQAGWARKREEQVGKVSQIL